MSPGITKTGIELELLQLSEQVLEPHGFSVVDLDFHVMARSILRLFVERTKRGEVSATGTNLDDCAEASRLMDAALEAKPIVTSAFDLEVSSPGLDRRLRTLSDFQKSLGKTVQVRFTRKLEEFGLGAKTTAEVLQADETALKFSASGKEYQVPWQHLKQANAVWKQDTSRESQR